MQRVKEVTLEAERGEFQLFRIEDDGKLFPTRKVFPIQSVEPEGLPDLIETARGMQEHAGSDVLYAIYDDQGVMRFDASHPSTD